jgi:quercetin dioxygenase-like cupin family protein
MKVKRVGTEASQRAVPESFYGVVWHDTVVDAEAPASMLGVRVTFEPGARTAWHQHPLGQMLHVLSGVGRVQVAGGPIKEIRPGDTAWIDPMEMHWHGASPNCGMVHLAFVERREGEPKTYWSNHVTDEEYLAEAEIL